MVIGTGTALLASAVIGAAGSAAQANQQKKSQKKALSQQEKQQQQAIEASRVSQFTPFGSLQFGDVGEGGQFTPSTSGPAVQVSETPQEQGLRETRQGISQGALSQLQSILGKSGFGLGGASQAIDRGGLPGIRSAETIRGILPSAQASNVGLPGFQKGIAPNEFSSEIARLEEATFEGVRRRLDPQFREQEKRLIQRLADTGIPAGSEAHERELQKFRESESEALTRAGFSSVQAGRTEQERLARLSLAGRGQAASERGQTFDERRSVLSDALQKQLSLAGLEGITRQQFGGEQERDRTFTAGENERQRAAQVQLAAILSGLGSSGGSFQSLNIPSPSIPQFNIPLSSGTDPFGNTANILGTALGSGAFESNSVSPQFSKGNVPTPVFKPTIR